ncbi:hypothetical protein AB1Y20_021328 [Prymnesium parvum]|uniref:AIG1-type G domain-containing protein n=1 Tax=Prymnesium parvum TaxID=97485 RepID=A0AB34JJA4_PRYPA
MEPEGKRKRDDARGRGVPTLCVLGATGVGKGSTLNSCFGSDKYSTSSLFCSDTVEPISHILPWRGVGEEVKGVDLCGFSDSEGRDSGFIETMVAYLREQVQSINCFLLLLNSQEARVGVHLKDMLVALKNVFGLPFMKNVLIGFTRWDYTKKGAILRRGVTKEALRSNVNGLLRGLLGHEHDCECVFLDNTVHMCSEAELQELYGEELPRVKEAFDEALGAVRQATLQNAAFLCGSIEGTLAERDVGRDQIEREKAAHVLGDEALASFSALCDEAEVADPDKLSQWLQDSAREARAQLVCGLASKTKPDLEHVMHSVLDSFDEKIADVTRQCAFKNRSAASSFNRSLRVELVDVYTKTASEQRDDTSRPARERFATVYNKYDELVLSFVKRCKGGSLAWQPLMQLQDELGMEQAMAREKILRDDLLRGNALPELSKVVKDQASWGKLLNAQPLPDWLIQSSSRS